MAQKRIQDDWGTGAREGYEDRGAFRPPRAPQREPGSPLLRILGAIAIVAGICWGTYLVTMKGGGVAALLYERFGTWTACFYGSAILALLAAMIAFGLRASAAAVKTAPLAVPATAK